MSIVFFLISISYLSEKIHGKTWRTFEFQKMPLRLFWFIWYLPKQPPKLPVSIRPLLWKEPHLTIYLQDSQHFRAWSTIDMVHMVLISHNFRTDVLWRNVKSLWKRLDKSYPLMTIQCRLTHWSLCKSQKTIKVQFWSAFGLTSQNSPRSQFLYVWGSWYLFRIVLSRETFSRAHIACI